MRVYVTTFFVCSHRDEKCLSTPHSGHLLYLLHERLPSCLSIDLSTWRLKNKKCSHVCGCFAQRSTWPISSFSSLLKCSGLVQERNLMLGWLKWLRVAFPYS